MTMDIEQKLKTLETEWETGQRMLVELDTKRTALANTMLRIEGAIQVLRELSEASKPAGVAVDKAEPLRSVGPA